MFTSTLVTCVMFVLGDWMDGCGYEFFFGVLWRRSYLTQLAFRGVCVGGHAIGVWFAGFVYHCGCSLVLHVYFYDMLVVDLVCLCDGSFFGMLMK